MTDSKEKSILNRKELAEYMGICESQANKLLHTPGFPRFYIGKRILCNRQLVEQWVLEKSSGA